MPVQVSRRLALSGLLGVGGGVLLTGAARVRPSGITVYGERSTVIGSPGDRDRLAAIAAVADNAVARVTALWPLPGRAVIQVPGTLEEAARRAGSTALAGLAAVATARTVVVVPDGFARLTDLGRGVVLTHELTHVATGAVTTTHLPRWLTEGFADYVGYRDSGLAVPDAAAELAEEVRAGVVPRELPGRPDFEPGSPRLAQAYAEAWLACRYLSGRYGERALVTVYREAVARGVPAALARLGLDSSSLTTGWRAHLATELG
ncbi:gluzincin family metallopeptidase [Streptosporangium soli]|nr:hypothetical protein [Streptosporangium sp. KLBMP 9127]